MPALGIQYTGRAGFIYQPSRVNNLDVVEIACRAITTVKQNDSVYLLVAVPANVGIDGASESIVVDSMPRRQDNAVVVWITKEAWYPTAPNLANPPGVRLQFSTEPNLTPEIPFICYLHPNINEHVSRKRIRDMDRIRGKGARYGSD